MNPPTDLLARALRLLRQRLDMDDAHGDAWLARETADDPALRAEVERLLAAERAASGPLDTPLARHALFEPSPADDEEPRLEQQIGPFVLRRLLGRGGMGSVYLAERADGGFEQTVALKLLHTHVDPSAQRRFARERQILVRLQHPNIARFLDGGMDARGQPWYAMERVDGKTLAQHAQSVGATLDERIELMLQVCDAVQFAHANLILHRDLKPANILVDAGGSVKLLDFGIAKLLSGEGSTDPDATLAGQQAFTPDYAAPEQVRGESVSTATDLYSLGVVLYELLTGSRPFPRSAFGPVLVADAALPEPPSRRALSQGHRADAARLRGDLDTIVATCLQPEPARRYRSVTALRSDLQRYLAGQPIEARPDAFGYRTA